MSNAYPARKDHRHGARWRWFSQRVFLLFSGSRKRHRPTARKPLVFLASRRQFLTIDSRYRFSINLVIRSAVALSTCCTRAWARVANPRTEIRISIDRGRPAAPDDCNRASPASPCGSDHSLPWRRLADDSTISHRPLNISRPSHPMGFACHRTCARRSPASHIIRAGKTPLLQFRAIIIASRYSYCLIQIADQ